MLHKINNFETPINFKQLLFIMSVFALTLMISQSYAEARDLVDAAQTAQSIINRIGIASISIGITLGAILFAMGAANLGRMLLISGGIGAIAILGAPAIINLLGKVFGASI